MANKKYSTKKSSTDIKKEPARKYVNKAIEKTSNTGKFAAELSPRVKPNKDKK